MGRIPLDPIYIRVVEPNALSELPDWIIDTERTGEIAVVLRDDSGACTFIKVARSPRGREILHDLPNSSSVRSNASLSAAGS